MTKSADEIADKLLMKRRELMQQASKQVVPGVLGEIVLRLLATQDAVTIDDLVREAQANAGSHPEISAAVIARVEALRTPR